MKLSIHPASAMTTRKYRKRKPTPKVMAAIEAAEAKEPVDEDKPHVCAACDKRFSRISALRCHEKIHNNYELPHACPDCERRFKNITTLNLHRKTHGKKRYPCQQCSESFNSLAEFRLHEKSHASHRCIPCKKNFKYLSQLKAHQKMKHQNTYFQSPTRKRGRPPKVDTQQAPGAAASTEITKSHLSTKEPEVANTMGKVIKEKKHTCTICQQIFLKLSELEKHLSTHPGYEPYKCPQCPQTFILSTEFNAHVASHDPDRRFHCQECGKAFRHAANLRYHSYLHTGEKPFECPTCKKAFRRVFTLKMHQLTHTGEKPHECHLCGRRFTQSSTLKEHVLTHSTEKPFLCSVCGKGFKKGRLLEKHMVVHGYLNYTAIPANNGENLSNGDRLYQQTNGTGGKSTKNCFTPDSYDEAIQRGGGGQRSIPDPFNQSLRTHLMSNLNDRPFLYDTNFDNDEGGENDDKEKDIGSDREEDMDDGDDDDDLREGSSSPGASLGPEDEACLDGAHLHHDKTPKPNVCNICGDSFKLPHVLTAHLNYHNGKDLMCTTSSGESNISTVDSEQGTQEESANDENKPVSNVSRSGQEQTATASTTTTAAAATASVAVDNFSIGMIKCSINTTLKPYKCLQCNKEFRLFRNLKTHMIIHKKRRKRTVVH